MEEQKSPNIIPTEKYTEDVKRLRAVYTTALQKQAVIPFIAPLDEKEAMHREINEAHNKYQDAEDALYELEKFNVEEQERFETEIRTKKIIANIEKMGTRNQKNDAAMLGQNAAEGEEWYE